MDLLHTFGIAFGLTGADSTSRIFQRMTRESDRLSGSLENQSEKMQKLADKTTDGSWRPLQQQAQNAGKAAVAVKALGAAMGIAALAAFTFKKVLDVSREGEQLLYLAHAAGVAADSYQKLSNASKIYGGSAQGTANTLANLNKMVNDLRLGKTADNGLTEAARLYGVGYMGADGNLLSPEKILDNVARIMPQLDMAQQLDIKSLLGLDDGLFNLMLEGYDKYIATLKKAKEYALDEKDLRTLQDLSQEWRQFTMMLKKNLMEAIAIIAPALTQLLEAANKLSPYTKKIAQGFMGFKETVGIHGRNAERERETYLMEHLSKKNPDMYSAWRQMGFPEGKGPNSFQAFMDKAELKDGWVNYGDSGFNVALLKKLQAERATGNTTNNIGIAVVKDGEDVSSALDNMGVDIGEVGKDLNIAVAGAE